MFIEEIDEDSKSDDDSISDDHVDGVKAFADKGLKARRILDDTELRMNETNLNETKKKERRKDPEHEFIWSWLPGFEGHDEPIHTLSNG